MRLLRNLVLSLLFSIPIVAFALLVILPLVLEYDLMGAYFLRPVLVILSLLWGAYACAIPFVLFFNIQKEGPKIAWEKLIRMPIIKFYLPCMGYGFLFYFWLLITLLPFKMLLDNSPPPVLLFIISTLGFAAEVVKVDHRKNDLTAFLQQDSRMPNYIRLGSFNLNFLLYAQSLGFYLMFWGSLFLGIYLIDHLLNPYLSRDILQLLYLFHLILCMLYIQKFERKIEAYARMHAY
ncbi:MAG: hypothetical protein AAFR87_11580, partial [Bacteroidota bacterium]